MRKVYQVGYEPVSSSSRVPPSNHWATHTQINQGGQNIGITISMKYILKATFYFTNQNRTLTMLAQTFTKFREIKQYEVGNVVTAYA